MSEPQADGPRTSNATAARRKIGDQKAIARLTEAGYTVTPPGGIQPAPTAPAGKSHIAHLTEAGFLIVAPDHPKYGQIKRLFNG